MASAGVEQNLEIEKQVRRFAAAVAVLKQYNKGHPVRTCWETAHAEGKDYWAERGVKLVQNDSLSAVARQAMDAYLEQQNSGATLSRLSVGLARGLTRLELVVAYKPHVERTVEDELTKLHVLQPIELPWTESRNDKVKRTVLAIMQERLSICNALTWEALAAKASVANRPSLQALPA